MKSYQSWGRYPSTTLQKIRQLQWQDNLDLGHNDRSLLAYGQGRSYGDVCLNENGTLLDTQTLDRFLQFDAQQGVLRCEAGVTLAEILQLVLPHGWFLPVTPGTKFKCRQLENVSVPAPGAMRKPQFSSLYQISRATGPQG